MVIIYRKFLKIFGVLLLAYTTLLLYQNFLVKLIMDKWQNWQFTLTYERNLAAIINNKTFVIDNHLYENAENTEMPSVSGTVRPLKTVLNDVFISVKTTKHYRTSRLPVIVKTWFQLAKKQIWFFTDTDDEEFSSITNGHLINTHCPASHDIKGLCCKMSYEYGTFLTTTKRWFCHFDDDNYVNVPRLVRFLEDYNPRESWYLGKPSVKYPYELFDRKKSLKVKFWFATGGAGICLSRALALEMIPVARRVILIS